MSERLAALADGAERAFAPLSALFELTGRCNLDCVHCYLDIAHPPPELSTAEAISVVDQLADAGTLFLTLSGGEIFLRRDAVDIARHARRRGMALRINTNATRIDRVLAAAVAALRPSVVEVSVYATGAAGHDAVTRRRSLRRTLRGVLLLRRAGVRVAIKAPLVAAAAADAARLADWADRLGAGLRLDPLVKPRLDGDRAPLGHRAGDDALVTALASRGAELGPPASPPAPSEAPCAIARRTVRIDADGNVYPCPSWPAAVGNLRTHRFADLWRGGPLLDELRALTVGHERGACAGCGMRGECSRCMATALVEHGDALGPSAEACRIGAAKPRARRLRVV